MNVVSNVYCVYINWILLIVMWGFGIIVCDFVIECYMDKVVCMVGMDLIELCILNVYCDGDMKVYWWVVKNCVLIESC